MRARLSYGAAVQTLPRAVLLLSGVACSLGLMAASAACGGKLAPLPADAVERDSAVDAGADGMDSAGFDAEAEADTGPPPTLVIATGQAAPVRVVVDSTSVYWCDNGTGNADGFLVKAGLDGGSQTRLDVGTDPWALTLNGGYVYWTSFGSAGSDGTIERVAVDGGAVETLAVSQSYPWGIATDGKQVYWTQRLSQSGTVSQAPALVPDPSRATILVQPTYDSSGLALRNGTLFWANYDADDGVFARAPTGLVTELATHQDYPFAITTDSNNVYWSTRTAIMAIPLGGGTAVTLAPAAQRVIDLATDGNYVYWTDYYADTITEVPVGGGQAITLATGQIGAYGIAVDASYVYWTTYTDGTVMKQLKWP